VQRERKGKGERRQAGPTVQQEGEGGGARAVRAERAAPLGRARVAGGGGVLGRQRPKARGGRGV